MENYQPNVVQSTVGQIFNFQKIVLIIVIVVLIITLAFIAMRIGKMKKTQTWPPVVSTCPDYWDISGTMCVPGADNVGTQGTCNIKKEMAGLTPCGKRAWADDCGIAWEGITYAQTETTQKCGASDITL
jgi:hypothetical protein